MNRVILAALILAACTSEPSTPAPSAEHPHPPPSAAAANPHSLPPGANPPGTPGALPPGAVAPAAHGTNPMAAQTAPRPLEKLADGRVALGPFSMAVPAGWAENPSTS